jgi:hypothetical protein
MEVPQIDVIGVYGKVHTIPSEPSPDDEIRELLGVPDLPVCERIWRGAGFRPTQDMFPQYYDEHYYERVVPPGGHVEYRYCEDISARYRALKQEEKQEERACARWASRYLFLTAGAPFAAFSWAPMLVFDTPVGYRVAQLILILLAASCLGLLPAACLKCHEDEDNGIPLARLNRVARLALLATVACIALLVCMVVGHRWSGWQWIFPVLTGLACLRVLYHVLAGTWDTRWASGSPWIP